MSSPSMLGFTLRPSALLLAGVVAIGAIGLIGSIDHSPIAADDDFSRSQAADSTSASPSDPDYSAELRRIPPLSPTEALRSFRIVDGFELELVAAEPLVADPVAMAFDEDGRLFVVEMRGYSEQADEHLGQIRLLEDTDQDGRFDKSHVFADGLSWPTAVACYDGGVFVGVAPDLIYLRDDDGDHKADHCETVYTGFGTSNVQGLLNSFEWGPDNRIHGATSTTGGEIYRPDKPAQTKAKLSGRDFAFDPKSRELTATSGGGQHGMTFNRWGDKFVCHNSDHLQMIVADERYLVRNPFQPSGSAKRSIAADGPQAEVFRTSPVEPWRIVRTRLRAQGIVPGALEGGGRASGYFTSATGITAYEGNAWPEENRGHIFVADVGSNLVHRKRLRPAGAMYLAERFDQGREFLTSGDIWFRPVQMCNGPDGALYIADMYREVIEHPKSLPESIKRHLDLTSGRKRGRIYRVVPTGFKQLPRLKLSDVATIDLAPLLNYRNAWHRRTSARLLYERQDASASHLLRKLSRRAELPEGRIAALHALAGIDRRTDDDLLFALGSDHAEVQRHAILLSESVANDSKRIRDALYELAASDKPRVQQQLAFSLGELHDTARFAALAEVAAGGVGDQLVLEAVASSLHEGAGEVLAELLSRREFFETARGRRFLTGLLRQIARQQAADDIVRLAMLIEQAAEADDFRLLFLCNHLGVSRESALWTRLQRRAPSVDSERVEAALQHAREMARDRSEAQWKRVESIGILRWLAWDDFDALVDQLLTANESESVQSAVLGSLSHYQRDEVADLLIDRWQSLTVNLREKAMAILYSRAAWSSRLLDEIDSGDLSVNDIGASGMALLSAHPNETVRQRVDSIQSDSEKDASEVILRDYQPALGIAGDIAKGEKVFRKICASCHQHKGVGDALGPNLSTAQSRGAEAMLLNILAPNREVNPQHLSYVVLTDGGSAYAGMIKSETATTVTLQRSSDETVSILRSEIESMKSTGLSLMPEGLGREIDVAAMADLLAFLRSTE